MLASNVKNFATMVELIATVPVAGMAGPRAIVVVHVAPESV